MNPDTCLLLLPADDDAPATWLHHDPAGSAPVRSPALAGRPMPVDTSGQRCVLVVPGIETLVLWLDLPARNPAQALAAARLLLQEHVVTPIADLHVAVGPAVADGRERLVVAVGQARMRQWMGRAAALGMQPDAVVPAPLLLPLADDRNAAEDDGGPPATVVVAEHDGHWLVRGPGLAFAAEPGLAEHIIGAHPRQALHALEAALLAGADKAPIDLLQGDFARGPVRASGWPAWRCSARAAVLLVASLPLLPAVTAGWHNLQASRLEQQALSEARAALPQLPATSDPLQALRQQRANQLAGEDLARASSVLLHAVESVPDAALDALGWADNELQATVEHANNATLEQLGQALAAAGFELVSQQTSDRNGRLRTRIVVRITA